MSDQSSVILTADQFQKLQSLGGDTNNFTLDKGMYSIPKDVYSGLYSKVSGDGARGDIGLPTPDGFAAQSASAAAAAAPGTPGGISINPGPSYEQFLQSQANKGPLVYNGGATPAGMNASDASILQSIYAPKQAAGGFVPLNGGGLGPPEHFAEGGTPSSSEMATWVTRRESAESTPHNSGLFNSPVPGRTDKLDSLVPGGSYVIPADVVSGLGEGNTMAGSAVLDKMFHTNPFGIQGSKVGHGGVGIPHPPGPPRQTMAKGGSTHTRIIAAGGEYLVHPEAVKKLGKGDMKKGHKILDHFVVHARKKTAAEMNKLPGPKR